MYFAGGQRCLVVDAQVHAWDASPHNQAAPAGEAYAAALLGRHCELAGTAVAAPEVERVSERGIARDVFGHGYVDRAVLQPVLLGELFILGFSPLAWHAEVAAALPGRFVLSGEVDPELGRPGSRGIAPPVRRHDLRGLTLCESRRPAGRLRLDDPWLRRSLARWARSGAGVVHLGVGPAARRPPWSAAGRPAVQGEPVRLRHEPVPRPGEWRAEETGATRPVAPAGFDLTQFRRLAAALPQVQFVLGAGCQPVGQLCRLAALPNVHVLLTELLAWIGAPGFAEAFGALLAAFGPGRLLFGSGYPMVRPGPLVRELAAYRFPREQAGRHPPFDAAAVRAVLGDNAARLYRIPLQVTASRAAAGA